MCSFTYFLFLNRVTITFFAGTGLWLLISFIYPKSEKDKQTIEMDTSLFKVSPGFIISSIIICAVLAALYTVFW